MDYLDAAYFVEWKSSESVPFWKMMPFWTRGTVVSLIIMFRNGAKRDIL